MLTNICRLSALMLMTSLLLRTAEARHSGKPVSKKDDTQVVIVVRAKGEGLEFRIGSERYTRKDVEYFLGQLRLKRDENTPIIAIVEEKVELRGLSEVPAMAVVAGFRNIHTYVYWPWTRKMAEIQFGPVVKFSTRPPTESSTQGSKAVEP
jgi:predicted metal-dependent TIM-barrel fold hydrolase